MKAHKMTLTLTLGYLSVACALGVSQLSPAKADNSLISDHSVYENLMTPIAMGQSKSGPKLYMRNGVRGMMMDASEVVECLNSDFTFEGSVVVQEGADPNLTCNQKYSLCNGECRGQVKR